MKIEKIILIVGFVTVSLGTGCASGAKTRLNVRHTATTICGNTTNIVEYVNKSREERSGNTPSALYPPVQPAPTVNVEVKQSVSHGGEVGFGYSEPAIHYGGIPVMLPPHDTWAYRQLTGANDREWERQTRNQYFGGHGHRSHGGGSRISGYPSPHFRGQPPPTPGNWGNGVYGSGWR